MRLSAFVVFSCVLALASCVTPKKEPSNNTNNNNSLCGNGAIDPGEQCDDGNTSGHDGCDEVCRIEPFCGSGRVDPGEECDDGNFKDGDGCAHDCTLEVGCGNGVLEVGEQCDDDNVVSGDGCTGDCRIEGGGPVCGNGILEYTEGCDDGNTVSGDGCTADCEREDGCGNGELAAHEQCDDGNNISGDGCSAGCTVEFICGNNVCDSDKGETCSFCPRDCCPLCGNGRLDAGEQCDDDNNENGDGCSRGCLDEDGIPECGNGIWELGEECDDGNLIIHDGCSDVCEKEFTCGDGECTSDMGETCQRCPFDCCPSCGNGVLQPGEQCDTTALNDRTCEYFGYTGGTLGCTNWCTYSFANCTGSGPVCGNGVVEYGETCDGGNLNYQDCTTLGFFEGTLFCTDCHFNTAGCQGRWRFFFEDFEDDNSAWSLGGSVWGVGSPTGTPSNLPSGVNCAGTNLTGNYNANMSWTVDCIVSEEINLSGATAPVLLFKSWMYADTYGDGGHVEVYRNGTWSLPASVTPAWTGLRGSQNAWSVNAQSWQEYRANMAPYVGSTIQLRFCWYSDSYSQYQGWYVDDIIVVEGAYVPIVINNGNDLGRALAGQPFSRQLTITNGSGNFSFTFQGGAPAWLSLNPTTGLLSGTPQQANLGTHTFTVRVVDNVNPVNTTQKTFTMNVVNGVWAEDFAGGLPAGWSIQGSVWQVGALGAGGPATCPTAPNCAATNLSGQYINSMAWDAHCLTTGDISLTGLSSATLSFLSWWQTETGFDGGRVQVKSNNTWGNPAGVTPAYNATFNSQSCWAYNDQLWKEHTVNLTPYVNQTIQLRFCFYSDGSVTYPGWYLDDLMILGN